MSDRFPTHSWHAGFIMTLKNREIVGTKVWQNPFSTPVRMSRSSGKGWQSLILLLVVLLHGLLIGYGVSWRSTYKKDTLLPYDALQVTFIDRVLPSRPRRQSVQKVDTTRSAFIRSRNAAEIPMDDPVVDQDAKKDIGQPLRLTMDRDEWEIKPVIGSRSLLDRQPIALPGRAEPYVEGIRFSRQLTPEQRLGMVGRMLFGGVDYDPCKEARNRMASARSQADRLDVDADLRIIEKNCRP